VPAWEIRAYLTCCSADDFDYGCESFRDALAFDVVVVDVEDAAEGSSLVAYVDPS